jgi:hypothetical protein
MQPEETFDRRLRGIGDDALRRYRRFEAAFLKRFRRRLKVGCTRSIRSSELSRRNELVEHRRIFAALLADQAIEFAAVAQRKMHVRANASRRRFQIGWVCEELDTLLDRGEPTDGTAFEPDIPVPPAWQAANAMRQTSASTDRERVAIQWKPH